MARALNRLFFRALLVLAFWFIALKFLKSSRMKEYEGEYKTSLDQNEAYWKDLAQKHLSWSRPFSTVFTG